jgi:hypothetical protein
MSTAKIKNIVLVVLLFLNVFFLAVAARDSYDRSAARRHTIESLGVIMQNGGIELSEGVLHSLNAPTPQKTSRDAYAEATIARAALGDCAPTDSGTPSQYVGDGGTATFNARDEFEIRYTNGYGSAAATEEMLTVAKKLLRRMKIDASELKAAESGGEKTVYSAVCEYRGIPTFNCVITFTFDGGGRLTGITGRRPSGVSEAAGGALRDLPTSMLGFLKFVLDGGAEVTKITAVTAGYRLNVGAFGTGELIPCWRFDTDAGAFYIDALTGAVEAVQQ